ncbi:hypothetical protein [Synechococcus sp. UW140]|uniref:hypothetical protein n=1 Tax=Synechococcus sp. UW140 TaxID=368503 RepID=UPI0010BDFC58|nr:hypothetical protein [Synechococcus sp. UW140]
MKLFTAFAASVLAASSLISAPASANECFGLTGFDASQCRNQQRSKASKARSYQIARSCPAGTQYHKIKSGGLLFKRTIAEGCYTPYEAAQLKMQADGIEQNRRANVMRNINANRQRQCFGSASSYGNTTYGNATCY